MSENSHAVRFTAAAVVSEFLVSTRVQKLGVCKLFSGISGIDKVEEE